MPNRIPTPGIKPVKVRKSPTAQSAVVPSQGLKKGVPTGAKPTRPVRVGSTPSAKENMPRKALTPAERQARAPRPMVGNDKMYKNKYGKTSWNNGYTN